MVDDFRRPGDSPGSFINGVAAGVRADLDDEYRTQIQSARSQMRAAQDQADAERICADKATMTARMAEYRRGRWYHVGTVITSAAAGFTMGFVIQRGADVRAGPVPIVAVAGLPGVIASALADESIVTRAALGVGGAMCSLGAITYALLNPRPPEVAKP